MKPAISVVLLTTLIGAGQGLFLAFYSAGWLSLLGVLPATQTLLDAQAALLSLGMLAGGLVASFFHLGHPERAWRAAAMWRTSWLSREVIALPVSMALILVYALLRLLGADPVAFELGAIEIRWSTLAGFGATLAVIALFLCTAMIYACLKFLRQWHSPLTVVNFILLGCASGFTLAAAVAAFAADPRFGYFSSLALFLTLCGFAGRWASLRRNRALKSPTSLQSAIGVHHPDIRQIAQGAMGGSFNTRAFLHQYGPLVVQTARRGFLLFAFLLPALLLGIADASMPLLCLAAFAAQYAGLLAERWYFFIEAEHPQNIYYRMIS